MTTMVDLFLPSEVDKARGKTATEIEEKILTPAVMARIEKHTGQQNNRRYMAYRLSYIVAKTHP